MSALSTYGGIQMEEMTVVKTKFSPETSYEEFTSLGGLLMKVLNKYKGILRSQDEIDDLKQEAYIIYCNYKPYLFSKYGENVSNFPSMMFMGWKWDIHRIIERKYLLIRKPGINKEKKDIYNIESDIPVDVYEDKDLANVENKDLVSFLLNNLDEVERFVTIRNFGLDGDKVMSVREIAILLKTSDSIVRNAKNRALKKMKKLMGVDLK